MGVGLKDFMDLGRDKWKIWLKLKKTFERGFLQFVPEW